jgi:hypothetical protein
LHKNAFLHKNVTGCTKKNVAGAEMAGKSEDLKLVARFPIRYAMPISHCETFAGRGIRRG